MSLTFRLMTSIVFLSLTGFSTACKKSRSPIPSAQVVTSITEANKEPSKPAKENTVPDPTDTTDEEPPPGDEAPQELPVIDPVFRLLNKTNGDYLYTLDVKEGADLGYEAEGIAFYVYRETQPDSVALLRCRTNVGGLHFLSVTSNCEGENAEGVLGYIFKEVKPETELVIRCRVPEQGYLVTALRSECNGFIAQGDIGYAPTKAKSGIELSPQ